MHRGVPREGHQAGPGARLTTAPTAFAIPEDEVASLRPLRHRCHRWRPDPASLASAADWPVIRSAPPCLLPTHLVQLSRAFVLATFRQVAIEVAGKNFDHVSDGTRLSELAIDSLEMVEIIGHLEQRLAIAAIPDERLVGLVTVGDLLTVVEGHLR